MMLVKPLPINHPHLTTNKKGDLRRLPHSIDFSAFRILRRYHPDKLRHLLLLTR
ncbi:hypothetical protein D3C76_686180 [compost metagenome]